MIKKFLLLSLLISLVSICQPGEVKAQDFGVSLGFGTSTALYGDLFYLDGNNSYHFGGTFQFSDALGDRISEDERDKSFIAIQAFVMNNYETIPFLQGKKDT